VKSLVIIGVKHMSEETVFIQHHAEEIAEEIPRLLAVLAVVEEIQWEKSPAPEQEVVDRRPKSAPPDPVGETVVDPVRAQARLQVKRSERIMADALVKVRGVRRGLEISLNNWERARVD
jgi:hypothetical protein